METYACTEEAYDINGPPSTLVAKEWPPAYEF